MPVLDPGAAVSPGRSSCNFENTPEVTVIGAVVPAEIDGCVTSEAVTVGAPAVLSVRLNDLDPATSAAFAGSAAFGSLEVSATVSLVLITFQFASTAFTRRLKGVPAV